MFGPKMVVEFGKDELTRVELGRPIDERLAVSLFVDWFGDNRIRQYLSLSYPITESSENDWLSKAATDPDNINWLVYIEGQLIGSISLMKVDRANANAELGIVIGDKNFWGRGIAPAIEAAVTAYALENIIPGGLNKVETRAYTDNERSIHALEKAGFKTIGKKREQVWKNGRWHDEWLAEALKKEWQEAKVEILARVHIKRLELYPDCE
jgi:RimJ/RimL family protein N-acetyltransferase